MESLNNQLKILYLVDNFGYSQSTSTEMVEDVVFYCFINKCEFETRNLAEMLENHLHDHNENWLGFCYACDVQIYTEKTSLLMEIKHLAEAHCHRHVNNGIGLTIQLYQDDKTKLRETVNAARAQRLSSAPKLSTCDDKLEIVLKSWKNSTMKKRLSKRCLYALYKCMDENCAFYTSSAEFMLTHLHDHENVVSKMDTPSDEYWRECAYCDLHCDSSLTLVQHIRDEHSSSLYQCPYCFYRSCAAYNVVFHLEKFHKSSKRSVLVCNGNEVHYSAEVIENYRLKNIFPLRCSIACNKIAYAMDYFIDHIKNSSTHEHQYFECQFCGDNIPISEATKHFLRHNVGIYQCIYCSDRYGTNNIDSIQNHMCHTHPTQLPYICVRLTRKHVQNKKLSAVESTMMSILSHRVVPELLDRCPFSDEQLTINFVPTMKGNSCLPWNANISNDPPELYGILSFNVLEKEYSSDDWDKYFAAQLPNPFVDASEKEIDCSSLVEAAQNANLNLSERVYSSENMDLDHISVHNNQPHSKTMEVEFSKDIIVLCPSGVGQKELDQLVLQIENQAKIQDVQPHNETGEREHCSNTTITPNNEMKQFGQVDVVQNAETVIVHTPTPENGRVERNKAGAKKHPTVKKKPRITKKTEERNPEGSKPNLSELVKYKCEYCRDSCMNSRMVYEHWKKKHKANGAEFLFKIIKIFKCFHCRHCNTYDDLRAHCKLKHAKAFAMVDNMNPLKCGLCDFQFKNEDAAIIDHFNKCHNMEGVNHTIKLENYLTDELLDRVVSEKMDFLTQQTDQIMYGCSNPSQKQKCNKSSCNELEVVAHIRKHNLLFKCKFCEQRLGSMIREHNLSAHNRDDETYSIIDVEEDLDKYLDLKIIFPNGLLLTKKESKQTRFGGMDEVIKTVKALDVRDLEAVRKKPNVNYTVSTPKLVNYKLTVTKKC